MAASDSDFDDQGRFSADFGDLDDQYDGNEIIPDDTNILNLDEDRQPGSTLPDTEAGEGGLPFDDQQDADEGPEVGCT